MISVSSVNVISCFKRLFLFAMFILFKETAIIHRLGYSCCKISFLWVLGWTGNRHSAYVTFCCILWNKIYFLNSFLKKACFRQEIFVRYKNIFHLNLCYIIQSWSINIWRNITSVMTVRSYLQKSGNLMKLYREKNDPENFTLDSVCPLFWKIKKRNRLKLETRFLKYVAFINKDFLTG